MHIFLSAGEPSGDLHGANLARALPGAKIVGFGGERMAAAGVQLLYPLTDLAVMWFGRVLRHLPTFFRLAAQARQYFERQRPDAVVLIDYPGFHWHLAKRAKAAGIPVYWFVPPQLWAWAGWRVKKMRASVDTVLTALPFEDAWYAQRGVNTHYVGHPYFDELSRQSLDESFVNQHRGASPIVALLPGSRNQEVANNTPLILNAAARIHAARPDVRFLVAAFRPAHAESIRKAAGTLPISIHTGRTPEIIELAQACIAVSGSVSLELLWRRKPSVIVYRGGRVLKFLSDRLRTCRYITLVNLLAEDEIYPEFPTLLDDEPGIARHVLRLLNDPVFYAECVARLTALRNRTAVPGACDRASDFLLSQVGRDRLAA